MAAPVKASPSQVVEIAPSSEQENEGSYPADLTPDQVAWLKERAAERRRLWAEHARSLAGNHKS